MLVTRSLLLKGLGICAFCAGGAVIYFKGEDLKNLMSSAPEGKRVWDGLECDEPTTEGSNCVLGKKIFVRREEDGSPFELTTLGAGKIKVYKVENEEYNEGFKFSIEDNDIAGTVETNKLEEFETYEIKLGGDAEAGVNLKGKHYLSRKTEAKTGIKNALGLSCDLPGPNATAENCGITNNQVGSVTITGGTPTLSISGESSKAEFPLGYKFTFKNTGTSDVTLTAGGRSTKLKQNSPVDFKIKREGTSLSLEKAWSPEELAKKVGLVKDGDFWDVGGSGINVRVDDSTKKESIEKYTDSQGRIKVYGEESGYSEGLRFTIEKGDLRLKEYDNSGSTKEFYLGQFQSFEVVKENNKWYLSKKDGGLEKIKRELGLPNGNCNLPSGADANVECTLTNDNIKTIKFDGKAGATATVEGNPKLTIYTDSGRLDYPLGYKFVFSSQSDASINFATSSESKINLKSNLSYEYKIKRSGENGQSLSLERAWTPKVLMEKAVRFNEGTDEEWSVVGDEISIKQESNKTNDAKANDASSKIKVYEGVPDYNQGMKFVIEGKDGTLTNGGNVSKLTKYETYEIIKDSGDNYWYFSRKKKAEEYIRELLGLPLTCSMPTQESETQTCDIDSSAMGGIKFEGKDDSGSTTIADGGDKVSLKISKETDKDSFPLGYKFTFSSEQYGFTVPKSGGDITIKKNTNTEFKIKEAGSTLSLEKAWTAESLGNKLGLSCSNGSCNFGSTISVWEGESSYVDGASITGSEKKLTFELDQENHNQGIKFSVDGSEDIDISGTEGGTSKPTKICKKNGETPTYEIAQKTVGSDIKWYLVKK